MPHRTTASVTASIACTSGTGDTVAITLHMYGADLSNGTSIRRTYQQRPEDATS
jgi:3-mercaptopropionate dioxygenase